MPFSHDVIYFVDSCNKSFNECFLAAKLRTGINCLIDGNKHFLILTVGIVILLNEHKDIVDIYFYLLDKFYFKDNIINNVCAFSLLTSAFPLITKVLVSSKIILQVTLCNQFLANKFIK